MNTKNIVLTLTLSFAALVGVALILFNQGEVDTTVQENVDVVGDARHVKGEGEVTIVEFSDFQCPACKAAEPFVRQVLDSHEGNVRFVYRHFPLLSIHPNAEEAGWASEAAHEQGKFWEYHDILFDKQDEWSGERDPMDTFVSYASELGLDLDKFRQDYESDQIRQIVTDDLVFANQIRLSGTPTFFVNGKQVQTGDLSSAVSSLVEEE